MSKFDEALAFVLPEEGGYSNDPADRGGSTFEGVTQRAYDRYRLKNGLHLRDVRQADPIEIAAFYRSEYWEPAHCDCLQQPMATVCFDSAVQHGPERAIKFLQTACELDVDGVYGPITAKAALAMGLPEIEKYMDARHVYYDAIIQNDPSQARFAHGWANRMASLQKFIEEVG